MEWLVYYSRFYSQGKGDPNWDDNIVGYSNLNEKDLFKALQKEYPDLPIRKKVKVDEYPDYYDNKGGIRYGKFKTHSILI